MGGCYWLQFDPYIFWKIIFLAHLWDSLINICRAPYPEIIAFQIKK